MSFEVKVQGQTYDRQRPITIAHLEPSELKPIPTSVDPVVDHISILK